MSKQLNETEKQLLLERLKAFDILLKHFPDAPPDEHPDEKRLKDAEIWARAATIDIYNTFNVLAAVSYRTRQMDAAADHIGRAFHAAFELVFSTKRGASPIDFARARSAVETALKSCNRLV